MELVNQNGGEAIEVPSWLPGKLTRRARWLYGTTRLGRECGRRFLTYARYVPASHRRPSRWGRCMKDALELSPLFAHILELGKRSSAKRQMRSRCPPGQQHRRPIPSVGEEDHGAAARAIADAPELDALAVRRQARPGMGPHSLSALAHPNSSSAALTSLRPATSWSVRSRLRGLRNAPPVTS